MDSFEWNKIVGAVLGTLLFVVALKIGSEMLFEVPEPAKPGYIVPGVAEAPAPGAATTQTAEEAIPDFGTVLPKADTAHGQQVSQRCRNCGNVRFKCSIISCGASAPRKLGSSRVFWSGCCKTPDIFLFKYLPRHTRLRHRQLGQGSRVEG